MLYDVLMATPYMRALSDDLNCENAIIDGVEIVNQERIYKFLTAWVNLRFHNGGVGFGGWVLGIQRGDEESELAKGKDYTALFLQRCMDIAGVQNWSDMKGQPVRCINEGFGGRALAIGHFLKDDWFCPAVVFDTEQRPK